MVNHTQVIFTNQLLFIVMPFFSPSLCVTISVISNGQLLPRKVTIKSIVLVRIFLGMDCLSTTEPFDLPEISNIVHVPYNSYHTVFEINYLTLVVISYFID